MIKMLKEEWISVAEAAQIIGCTLAHVRLLANSQQIQGKKLGAKTWMISRRDAEHLAKKPRGVGRPRKFSKGS